MVLWNALIHGYMFAWVSAIQSTKEKILLFCNQVFVVVALKTVVNYS